ncbi:Lrp/AsnC family transcriptional regulator [Planomonospora parontospora]|uniref:Lrp/AsnC family transcriptional regulator n=1 Tax=Planomonospora parontospora TaxID=58119 RepID=UPI00166FA1BC|nr:Lrp/AsnC family transcriptional regulator [Planomonospora parontospora]GGL55839.1 AsnC family transcriptional regulator [Planomonospora parontospora subsp. antibiotica]GII19815.1 AsnC family transcriptional regulator [Planomonospora parontospora subsp. antibiotica]
MDATDRAILSHLQVEGRLSNLELADRVRLTPSPCLRRVRNLEETGVITGYRAVVDPAAVGRGFQVLAYVELQGQDADTVTAFEAAVMEIDDVVECLRMFGHPDYVLRVAVPDMEAYSRLRLERLGRLPGLDKLTSQIAMKALKPGGVLPL